MEGESVAEESQSHGWWQTVPGVLTATAGIITAVTGLLVALSSSGIFKQLDQPPTPPPVLKIRDELLAKAREFTLGSPHTETPEPQQTPVPRNEGYWQRFERGYVYWSPTTDAHAVLGAIFDMWADLGREQGMLGFPTTDELPTPDNRGRFNHFQGGSIYWTPQTGAQEVHGLIRDKWASMGWERSFLGYPVSAEKPYDHGRISEFEHGRIIWTPAGGIEVKHE